MWLDVVKHLLRFSSLFRHISGTRSHKCRLTVLNIIWLTVFCFVSFVMSLKVLSKEAAVEYEGKSWSLVKSELNNSQPDVREHFMFYLD